MSDSKKFFRVVLTGNATMRLANHLFTRNVPVSFQEGHPVLAAARHRPAAFKVTPVEGERVTRDRDGTRIKVETVADRSRGTGVTTEGLSLVNRQLKDASAIAAEAAAKVGVPHEFDGNPVNGRLIVGAIEVPVFTTSDPVQIAETLQARILAADTEEGGILIGRMILADMDLSRLPSEVRTRIERAADLDSLPLSVEELTAFTNAQLTDVLDRMQHNVPEDERVAPTGTTKASLLEAIGRASRAPRG